MSRLLLCAMCGGAAFAAPAQTVEIAPELWDRPRTGATVLAQESVKSAMRTALAKPEARILIHHGAGPEPAVQAEELRAWLVALAIEPQRIELRGDLGTASAIKIEILP